MKVIGSNEGEWNTTTVQFEPEEAEALYRFWYLTDLDNLPDAIQETLRKLGTLLGKASPEASNLVRINPAIDSTFIVEVG